MRLIAVMDVLDVRRTSASFAGQGMNVDLMGIVLIEVSTKSFTDLL